MHFDFGDIVFPWRCSVKNNTDKIRKVLKVYTIGEYDVLDCVSSSGELITSWIKDVRLASEKQKVWFEQQEVIEAI